MGRLAGFTAREVRRVVETLGWQHIRTAGDHFIYSRPGARLRLSIPDHRTVAEGTLRRLVAQMGLSVDEFLGHARK